MANLTTIERVRRHLFGSLPPAGADDILLDMIAASSLWVENEIGWPLLSTAITETRDGTGGTTLRLLHSHTWRPGRPPTSISSLTIDGSSVPGRAAVSPTNTNPSGYTLIDDTIHLIGHTFTVGVQNVVIGYTHGFPAVPLDIEQATIEHVALRYMDRSHIGLGSASGLGEAATFSGAGIFAFVESVLRPYRAPGFA